MKKIALVLAVLLVVGGAAFAEVTVGGEATVSGSVSTTIGMDLQSGVWGADAGSSISVSVPLANGSAGASGDDNMYGEITLSDIYVNINDIDDDGYGLDEDNSLGDISAKIVAGNICVGLNKGGYNFNNAAGSEDYDVNIDDAWYPAAVEGDLKVGFDNGMINVAVDVAAKSGLTRADDATDEVDYADAWSGYTASADATDTTQGDTGLIFAASLGYTSDMISVPVSVTFDPAYDADTKLLGVSANPSVTAGPVTVAVPVDFVAFLVTDANDMGLDLAPTLTFAVMDGLSINADAYIYDHVDVYGYGDVGFGVAADGLVSGLTASVDVDLTNVAKDLGWGVDVAVGYAVADGLTVNVAPGYDSTDDVDVAGSVVFGSAFTGIDNTTITLDYASGCYNTSGDVNLNDAGILSLVTEVAF